MVKTHVIELESGRYMIAFIYPEKPKDKLTYTPSPSLFDIERRLAVIHKNYIAEKLQAWLHQRVRARQDQMQLIRNVEYAICQLLFRPADEMINFIRVNRLALESIAPGSEKSRCLAHYQKVIIPILDFCTTESKSEDFFIYGNLENSNI